MPELAQLHCKPLEGQAAMGTAEIEAHLKLVSDWALAAGAIEKRYKFKNYHETMAFVNAQAWVAHNEDHHPELAVSYAACTVRFNTHSVGGISINDFICAARLDALVA
ncbi:MAG TPA: 4a-hydroxytetrahydrobiopterin dehydratase [Rubrivivax sp.]